MARQLMQTHQQRTGCETPRNVLDVHAGAKSVATGLAAAKRELERNWQLYLLLLLPLSFLFVFLYRPMYGAQIAFRSYRAVDGITGSAWVGFEQFAKFLSSYQFRRVLTNTLAISVYGLVAGFPIPVMLALALNNVDNRVFKKTVQMVTYAPHFISIVVVMGMLSQLFSYQYGLINKVIRAMGGEGVLFLGDARYFRSLYVWSGVWQGMGYSSIIYISALSAIDPTLYEAAKVDGATRIQRIWHIEIPGILPTIITLFILNTGGLLSVGHEKVLLLQNTLNLETSETISTYVYRLSFQSSIPDYSYSTAIGLFNSVVNFIVILSVNALSKRVTETSLW